MAGVHDLRAWLSELDRMGWLETITGQVDPRYELGAVTKRHDGTRAVLFTSVRGYAIRAVSNICATRAMYAHSIQEEPCTLTRRLASAVASPQRCCTVHRSEAPCKQNAMTSGIDLLSLLPVATYHARDSGPYITAGVLTCRDTVGGGQNLSIHRLQITGPDRLGTLILPRHLWHYFRQAEDRSTPLPVAIAIGVSPALLLASQAITQLGVDECQIASALLGEPVRLVRAETSDLLVPASAEIVIEGLLLPQVREEEGPFGEYPRCYGPKAPRPVIQVTAVTYRDDPIYHTILPASMEHLLMGGLMREATLLNMVEQIVPTVKAVHLTPGGSCRYHAVVSIEQTQKGEAKNAILAALNSSQEVKRVIVVDPDIDIFDPNDVEWAMATRMQADRDLVIVPGTLASKLDPSTEDGVGARLGIDATIPVGCDRERFEKIRIPGFDTLDMAKHR